MTLFLSCHFQSFQSSGATSSQQPGACETNSFPSPFSVAKLVIVSFERKNVKVVKYRVNAGTWPCATHVNERWHSAIYRRLRSTPNDSRRDRRTKDPRFSIRALPGRFRRPDLLYPRRRSSDGRALSAISPCWADETTYGQSFRATVSP